MIGYDQVQAVLLFKLGKQIKQLAVGATNIAEFAIVPQFIPIPYFHERVFFVVIMGQGMRKKASVGRKKVVPIVDTAVGIAQEYETRIIIKCEMGGEMESFV